jgi:hypothetical protein
MVDDNEKRDPHKPGNARIGLAEAKGIAKVMPDLFKIAPDDVEKVSVNNLEIHELALAFPAYGEKDMAELAEDIRDHGMRLAITLFEGKVLDGRNRVEAARKAGLTLVPSGNFEGTYNQARDYVISLNLNRRHLTDDQRSAIAAKLATMPQGGDRSKPPIGGLVTVAEAAGKMKVSKRTVERAKAVGKEDPALLDEVAEGKTKLGPAVKKAAALKALPKVASKKDPAQKDPSRIEQKRHEERMKSARYKLEAFIREYADMPEWKRLVEAIKAHPEMAPGKVGAALKPDFKGALSVLTDRAKIDPSKH